MGDEPEKNQTGRSRVRLRRPLEPLEVRLPTLFRCPISLEVMRSPVSLSTGVSYDRSSIQRWLDSGHRTCPATRLPLSSVELVPNLTLRRLIQGWSADHSAAPAAPAARLPAPVNLEDDVTSIVSQLAEQSDSSRAEAAVRDLASMEKEKRERAVSAMVAHLDRSVSALIGVLKNGIERESRIGAARLIESILISPLCDADLKKETAEREALIAELVELIREGNADEAEAGLDCLLAAIGCIERRKRLRLEMVRAGAVPALVNSVTSPELQVAVIERAMRLLEEAARCTEGREAIAGEAESVVSAVVGRMMKVGREGREAAVATLWLASYGGGGRGGGEGERRVREAVVVEPGVVGKLLVVMQEECSPASAAMAGDLLRICAAERGRNGCLERNYSKTLHVMPF